MIGSRIGNYELVREIPGGGMGRVFEAIQLTLSRTVAIKVLRQELAESDDQAVRFRREADTLARLDHENIVRVYDVVEHEGGHCIVMEYVGGPSLGELLRRAGRFPPAFARDVAADIAGALSAAHGSGIIHRDIKPGNVLFTSAGRPKLADFGIARIVDTATNTQSQLVGTPYYMSPEQVRGEGLSAASDVYSLGVVLYEMLSGRVPFSAETPIGVALKHVQEAPPALSDIERDLPAELCRLIDRALDKDAKRRYGSAQEFQDTLQRLSLGAPSGRALRSLFPRLLAGTGELICRGCTAELQPGFLTCPQCGRSVRGTGAAAVVAAARGSEAGAGPGGASGPAGGIAGRPSGRPVGGGADDGGGSQADTGSSTVEALIRSLVSAMTGAVEAARGSGAYAIMADVWRRALSPRSWPTVAMIAGVAALAAALVLLPASTPPSEDSAGGETAPTGGTPVANAERGGRPAFPAGGLGGAGGAVVVPPLSDGLTLPPPSGQPIAPPPGRTVRPVDDPPPDRRAPPRGTPAPPDPGRAQREDGSPADRPETPPADGPAGLDEAAAAREIDAILDRQRRATESGDIDLLLRDVDSRLHRDIRRAFAGMHRDASNVKSEITNRTVRFSAHDSAQVSFHAVITGTRRGDRQRITITDRIVVWRLARSDGRWLIISST